MLRYSTLWNISIRKMTLRCGEIFNHLFVANLQLSFFSERILQNWSVVDGVTKVGELLFGLSRYRIYFRQLATDRIKKEKKNAQFYANQQLHRTKRPMFRIHIHSWSKTSHNSTMVIKSFSSLCGRPIGRVTHVAVRLSVSLSVCPVRARNSKTKRRKSQN